MTTVINSQKKVTDFDAKIVTAVKFLQEILEEKVNFEGVANILSELPADIFEAKKDNLFFVSGHRIAYALDVYVNDQPVRVFRTEEIFLDEKTPRVNQKKEDVLIASRVLLPLGVYALLGKAEKLRGKFDIYKYLELEIVVNKEFVAFEHNIETGEKCVMVCAKVYVKNPTAEFVEALRSSPNISFGSDPEAEKTAKVFD